MTTLKKCMLIRDRLFSLIKNVLKSVIGIAGRVSNGDRSASTLPRGWAPVREERFIKFSGIGPVDESGMPIASRSVRPKKTKTKLLYLLGVDDSFSAPPFFSYTRVSTNPKTGTGACSDRSTRSQKVGTLLLLFFFPRSTAQ